MKAITQNKLFKDSFWAILGNGLGSALMLASGILIARMLGKDLYGEYGIVKSTMVYAASFASFGLSVTSTKFVAQAIKENSSSVKSVIRNIIGVASCFSLVIAILLFALAHPLAIYLGTGDLTMPLRVMSVIMIARAVNFTATGILGGLGEFRKLAINNVIAGAYMLAACIPLTRSFSLGGALGALLSYQIVNSALNLNAIRVVTASLPGQVNFNNFKELISQSFPIALRDSSYVICNWVAILMLSKMTDMGELGVYTAATQWSAIITCIPGLLNNVVLSHLSATYDQKTRNMKTVRTMLVVYLSSTSFLFLLVAIFSRPIASMYGTTFDTLVPVLRLIIFATIPDCCSEVFQSEFVALGRNWFLFSARLVKDTLLLLSVYLLLSAFNGNNGAYYFAIASLAASFVYFVVLILSYLITEKKRI